MVNYLLELGRRRARIVILPLGGDKLTGQTLVETACRSSLGASPNIQMKHSDFRIGLEFWCGGRHWRCTDVGTRIITAISLEPHEVVEITPQVNASQPSRTRRYTTDDPGRLMGPPYRIIETVFDESDIESCSLLQDDDDADYRIVG